MTRVSNRVVSKVVGFKRLDIGISEFTLPQNQNCSGLL